MTTPWKIGSRLYLARSALDDLIQALRRQGYSVLGPRVTDGAISLLPIESAAQLPQGLSDEQDGGSYRVVEGEPELTLSVRRRAGRAEAVPLSGESSAVSVSRRRPTISCWTSARRRCPSWRCWGCGRASWRRSRSRTACSAGTIRGRFAASRSRGTRRFARRPC